MASARPALSSEEKVVKEKVMKGKAVKEEVVKGNVVKVRIYLDGKKQIQAKNFKISKSAHEQVLWLAGDGISHFNVDFEGDSPFAYRQFSDLEPYSGLVRREVLGDPAKYYKYTVSGNGKSKDPGGVVNP